MQKKSRIFKENELKKDYTTDYVTSAFCMWARHNCRSYDEEVAEITKRARSRAQYADPAKLTAYIDAEIQNKHAELLDIAACDETFKLLEHSGDEIICKAIHDIYMVTPYRVPYKREISQRVLRFALNAPASERTVYRWLRRARRLFCELRGLRSDER